MCTYVYDDVYMKQHGLAPFRVITSTWPETKGEYRNIHSENHLTRVMRFLLKTLPLPPQHIHSLHTHTYIFVTHVSLSSLKHA